MSAPETCVWKEDGTEYEGWDTSCGNKFFIVDGCPSDNDFKFCCYCGKPLEEQLSVWADEIADCGGAHHATS